MSILTLRGLKKYFGGLTAVDDVSFSVEKGSIYAVIGPNGAGKTTVFNCITGSFPVSGGAIFFEDTEITNKKAHVIASLGVIRTFQNLKLSLEMSVLENTMIGGHIRSRAGFLAGMLNVPFTWKEEKDIEERAYGMLGFFGLAGEAHKPAGSLPFGKLRLLELARALSAEPKLLLLDEPASGLNMHETEELGRQLVRIRDLGVTILLVEHDMSLVMDISNTVLVLNFGKTIALGPPKEIQKNPEVIDIYLGVADA